jgi:hypothetical protein
LKVENTNEKSKAMRYALKEYFPNLALEISFSPSNTVKLTLQMLGDQ